ncbi:phage tail family protein [Enterococcus casseliflavus]|uniref:distal tail protein Dit n=1 Tax=Enterococcus casseliflavus TaxID=37734 RepID=UPI002DB8DC54|nr:distal tail protein Dit [Enterococcus casseliflavus]MEB6213007.1 phage tail family protein [Enterococcus casseliflavus]
MSFYQDRYITLDGKSSKELFYITKKSEQLLSKSINTQAIPSAYGDKVKSVEYNSKTIKYSILFTMEQLKNTKIFNINDLKREIAKYFDSNEVVKLWDSQDPNIYYNVLFQGTSEIQFLGNKTAITEIEFLVPDGLGYSVVEKEFVPKVNADGILEVIVDSQGTALSDFRVQATMNHDNGYFGVVSENGVMEFGKREEADGVIAEKSIILASNKNGNFSDWEDGAVFYENPNKKPVTTMIADSTYGLGRFPNSFTNVTNSSWFGAIKQKTLSETSKNWYLWAQAWFETGVMGQTGEWALTVIDKNNNLIAGMAIEKNDTVGNKAFVSFLVGNGKGSSRVIKNINFTPSYWLKNNPYGSEAKNSGRNPFDIRKEGSDIRFFWYGKYFTFTIPELADTEAKTLQFFVGQYYNRSAEVKQKVTHMYLNNLAFTKTKVPYWKDVPNRYAKGDVISIETETKTPYVNNLVRYSDQLKGTEYFKLANGETKVQFYYSDFSTPIPSVKLYLREAYI